MPTKLNQTTATIPTSASSQRSQQASLPVARMKSAVTQLARAFSAPFGFLFLKCARRPAPPTVQVPSQTATQSKAPTKQMIMEARAQADRCISRTLGTKPTNNQYQNPKLTASKQELLHLRNEAINIKVERDNLTGELAKCAPNDKVKQLEIRHEILKKDEALFKNNTSKMKYKDQVDQLSTSQQMKIENHHANLQSKLSSSSGPKLQDLRAQALEARYELLNLKMAEDDLH